MLRDMDKVLEKLMHDINMFDRKGALSLDGFEDSGADWLSRYKPYIEDGDTVVVSPHKVYGPETNDLVLQLRKRGIDKVILAGMSANLCTESHLRELLEQGQAALAQRSLFTMPQFVRTERIARMAGELVPVVGPGREPEKHPCAMAYPAWMQGSAKR